MKSLKVSEMKIRVTSRAPQSRDLLRRKIQAGYDCDWNQAEALLTVGVLNKLITYDKLTDQYSINDEKTHG